MSNQYDLMYCVRESIFNNRLMFVAITSSAKGAIENEGFQFGQGKSHLAMGLSTMLHQMAYNCTIETAEEHVKQNMGYSKADYEDAIKRGFNKRIICQVMDDMEVDFGKHRSHDNEFRELAYFSQTLRPQFAVILGTMPDLGQIARAWRDLFLFEIKVPFRGYCEIQKLKRWTDFYDPLDPKIKLDYKGEQEFPEASENLKRWYEPWRVEQQKKLFNKYHEKYSSGMPTYSEEELDEMKSESSRAGSNLRKLGWAAKKAEERKRREQQTINI